MPSKVLRSVIRTLAAGAAERATRSPFHSTNSIGGLPTACSSRCSMRPSTEEDWRDIAAAVVAAAGRSGKPLKSSDSGVALIRLRSPADDSSKLGLKHPYATVLQSQPIFQLPQS